MALKLITPPAIEPLSLDEAKLHCRVDGNTDDSLLTALIKVAREDAETICSRALAPQTWELVLDEWPAGRELELPRPPLQGVVSITYRDADGVDQVFDVENYVVDADSEPGRIVLTNTTWPNVELYPVSAVRVRYTAGYQPGQTPEKIRQAMKLLVGHYYENREAVMGGPGSSVHILPMAVDHLLATYRMWSF